MGKTASVVDELKTDAAVGENEQEQEKRVFLVTPGQVERIEKSHDCFWLSEQGRKDVRQLRCDRFFIGREVLAIVGTGRRFRQTLSFLLDGNPVLHFGIRVIRTPLCGGPEMLVGERILLADQSEHSPEGFCGISAIGQEAAWGLVNQWLDEAGEDLLICAGQEFLEALGWPEAYRPATLYKLDIRHNWVDEIVS